MAFGFADFSRALERIAHEAMTDCSAEQLMGIGALLGHLGQACHALAAVKQATALLPQRRAGAGSAADVAFHAMPPP
ncbi:MAG: hypothetical protein Q8Q14_03440, partial [Gemmatimonadales bacterium]|nr:hypothetical protein [Gemmatimonadales bacterium]